MRGATAFALAALALAGCAADPPASPSPFDIPSGPGRAVLSGAVADAGLKPVAGATVEVLDTGHETTSDGDARFLLALPTGEHVVELRHPDFAPTRQAVTVGPDGTRGVVLRFSSAAPA